jgi:spermidine synthase
LAQRFRGTVVVFTLTLFCSAALLFFVELMIGKMILPKFGGTPAVWNTCMVFFQSALLAGYAYAHACSDRLTPRRQTYVQLVLLALPLVLLLLPIQIDDSWAPPGDGSPAVWLLWLMVITVGLPFFIISTSAPLLSKWFASTGDPAARDPYFLYAASNVGSMVGLFGYPLVVEPAIGLAWQSRFWAVGYCVLFALIAWCATRVWRAEALVPELATGGLGLKESADAEEEEDEDSAGVAVKKKKRKRRKSRKEDREAITRTPAEQVTPPADNLSTAAPDLVAGTRPTLRRYLDWILLAFVPSSLMLAVTTYLTTDIASMPLLWVLPLGLYLLSFILVFAQFDWIKRSPLWTELARLGVALLGGRVSSSLADKTREFGLHGAMVLLFPVAVLLLVFLMVSGIQVGWIGWAFLLHLSALFVVSMVCHGELARTRPATQYLTGFYLCMSIGGVLGGMFNALAAPVLFNSVAEYPIVLVIGCLLLPPFETGTESKLNYWIDIGLAVALGIGAAYALWKLSGDQGVLLSPQTQLLGGSDVAFICIAIALLGALLAYPLLSKRDRFGRALDVGLPVALLVLSTQLFLRSPFQHMELVYSVSKSISIGSGRLVTVLTFGLPVALCYGFAERPVRFGLGVAAIFLAGAFTTGLPTERDMIAHKSYTFSASVPEGFFPNSSVDLLLHQERSFFGVLKVEDRVAVKQFEYDEGEYKPYLKIIGNFIRLLHGTTLHGEQRRNSQLLQLQAALASFTAAPDPIGAATIAFSAEQELYDRRNEALTYYHRTGPVGQVYSAWCPRGSKCDVAFIGLGTGTMASYVEPGQHADIYEIDSAVVRLASDPKYFTYLRDCRGAYDIQLGDARLKMREADPHKYRVIVVDAFSSDAIPVHLITKEAVQLYFDKLEKNGVVAIHISNRHLRLGPVLANIAKELGKAVMREYDNDEQYPGKNTSDWVVMANSEEALAPLMERETAAIRVAKANALLGMFGAVPSVPNAFANYYSWDELKPEPGQTVWTDDFSNILSVLRWK